MQILQAVNGLIRQQEGNQPEIPPASTHKPLPDRQQERRPEPQRGSTATANQIRAIYGLCRRKRLDPQKLAHERFDRYVVEDLTIREASELLDELKQDMPLARPTA